LIGPRQGIGESASDSLVHNTIDTAIYRDAVGVVTGMQDDVDSTYTMRRFVEDTITDYCGVLEQKYNDGKRWPPATRIARGGINPAARSAGEVTTLQSWVDSTIKARLYGTVNGMKMRTPTYTLRDFLEAALNRRIVYLKRQHPEHLWPPREYLRRGRRGSHDIPME
jgi:hypothetical protein